jgi:hypothetical protein
MWGIYSKAKRVLVWLGEEQDKSFFGMEMVRLLSLHLWVKIGKGPLARAGLPKKIVTILEDLGIAEGIEKERDEKERQAVPMNSHRVIEFRSRVYEEGIRIL